MVDCLADVSELSCDLGDELQVIGDARTDDEGRAEGRNHWRPEKVVTDRAVIPHEAD